MNPVGKVRAFHQVVFASLLCVLGTIMASADRAEAYVLVLDVCMKECTEEDFQASRTMRDVLEHEVKSDALVSSVDDMLARLGGGVPMAGITTPTLTAQRLAKELQDGIEMWTGGQDQAAAESLKQSLSKVLENPALVADDATLRTLVQKAYIARSVSLYRQRKIRDKKDEAKDPRVIEARVAMEDLVRMTAESSIKDTWGSAPDYVFQLSRDVLSARGTGTLSIQINDPSAVFYLHPAGPPHSRAFAGDVYSGTYYVFVTDSQNRSRRYRVTVVPHQSSVLNIDWRRDTKLEARDSSPRRIGFTFASMDERRREADFASDIGAQVPGSLVLVFGRVKWEGKDALMGEMYGADGGAFRVGVALGTDAKAAHDLAFYLMTDKPAPDIIKLDSLPWDISPSAARSIGVSRTSKWLLIGSGAIAITSGVTLYGVDRDAAPYGLGLAVLGIATAGLGLWIGSTPSRGPVVSVTASRATIGWAGRF
jgi:hypothetical protein